MNREVFLSLLALDSYNRNYGQNVILYDGDITSGQNEAGRQLGGATILNVDLPNGSISAGFYAIAYDWNGETIISYRGTNFEFDSVADFLGSPLYNDVFGGWTLGKRMPGASQCAYVLQ
ncbi:hypothetical protein IM511_06735 [Erythrobacteraceae bacterium E2-1 Yellow Sea]|nr:hypothetical protein [Erythrobacteraceae bacterium E2-1 Yellow Sea]